MQKLAKLCLLRYTDCAELMPDMRSMMQRDFIFPNPKKILATVCNEAQALQGTQKHVVQ